MRLYGSLLGLSLVGNVIGLHARDATTAPSNSTLPEGKRYIIEFSQGTNQQEFISQLSSRIGTKVLKVFDSPIFTGVSIESHTDNIDSLIAVGPQVANVWASKKLTLQPLTSTSAIPADDAAALAYTTHSTTGVDKLHAQGIFGKGVVIAVVDSGISYTHPALGGGFGPGFKVAGGYDFIGNELWPYEGEREPDDDPLDKMGHGTHVAGILAGKNDWFTGVAPEATLLAYKVFGEQDGTYEEIVVEAFLAAYEAGVDIITCSIGGASGWSSNAWAVVASRIVEEGIVVTIAAGNSGTKGVFLGSTGASGKYVLAVASVKAGELPAIPFLAKFHDVDGTTKDVEAAYRPNDVSWSGIEDLPFYPVFLNASDDELCSRPDNLPDLTNLIPLIQRSNQCQFSTQADFLAEAGAKYIMFYNNEQPFQDPWYFDDRVLGVGMLSAEAGQAIISEAKAGGSVTATFYGEPDHYVGVSNSAAGKPSYYTSWGGLYDLDLKPEIAAPGEKIVSTFLDGQWIVYSGTSMACPYVAGIAALYIGQYGGRSAHGANFAKDLAARIISSGAAVPWSDGQTEADYGFWAPPAQVGNGLINAVKVLETKTTLSLEGLKFVLNDTHHFDRYHSVDITNNEDKAVTYSFRVQDAAGVNSFVPYDPEGWMTPRMTYFYDLRPIKLAPTVKFPSGTFTVKPGQTKKAEFIFKLPVGGDETQIPVYGGKILIDGSNGDQLSVPYFGVAADVKKEIKKIWASGAEFPFSVSTPANIDISKKSSYTFDLSLEAQDFPKLTTNVIFGTQEIRWDIFEAKWAERKWQYPPVVGQNGYVGAVTSWKSSDVRQVFDPAKDDPYDIVSFPVTNLPRDVEFEYWWLGGLANGSLIAPGNYTMRIAALVPFGVREHADNWDVWQTPQIQVLGR